MRCSPNRRRNWVAIAVGNVNDGTLQICVPGRKYRRRSGDLLARSPGAVRLGHRRPARLHLQKAVLSTDATPGKKASAHCRGQIPARGVWQVLQRMTPYNEPANQVLQQQERGKKIRHHLQRLRLLGIDISALQLPPLPPLTPSDGTRLLTGTPHPLGVLGIHARQSHIRFSKIDLAGPASLPKIFQAGNVLCYEPLLTAGKQAFLVEDTFLIVPTGYETLNPSLPYSAEDIEQAMAKQRR